MAAPVTIGGTTFVLGSQGDSFAWGSGYQQALQQVALVCLQTTGGSFPLTADLNLGTSFGVIAKYIKSASGTIAGSGVLRLAKGDVVGIRNNANSSDNLLGSGVGVAGLGSGPVDELFYQVGGGSAVQVTGQPGLFVYMTTNPTAASLISPLKFDTVVSDSDSAYAVGTGLYTVPTGKGGWYHIDSSVLVTNSALANASLIIIAGGNNIAIDAINQLAISTGTAAMACSATVFLNAGQTINIQISVSAGTVTTAAFSRTCQLSIKRLV